MTSNCTSWDLSVATENLKSKIKIGIIHACLFIRADQRNHAMPAGRYGEERRH